MSEDAKREASFEQPSVEQVVEQPKEPPEEPLIITSRQKNPKNVAAGKMGAISKAEKRKNMQRLLEEQEQQHSSYSRYVMIAVGVSVLATAAYKYLSPKKEEEPLEKVHVEEPEKRIQRGKPISMFD